MPRLATTPLGASSARRTAEPPRPPRAVYLRADGQRLVDAACAVNGSDAAGERRRSTERKAWWGARRRSQSRRPQESNGKHARRQHHQPSARRTAHASLDFRLAAAVPFDIRVQTSVGAWPIFVIGRDMRIAPEAFHLSTPHRLAPYCISGTFEIRSPAANVQVEQWVRAFARAVGGPRDESRRNFPQMSLRPVEIPRNGRRLQLPDYQT